jgi:hypothetical protein
VKNSHKAQVAIDGTAFHARNLKGQVATEFFMYTAVFMFVVIAAFFVVNQVQSTEIPVRENTIAKETGEFFASSITLAVKGGTNFTYKYTFPTTVLGKPYTLRFSDTEDIMVLDWEGRYGRYSQSYSLPGYDYGFPDKYDNNQKDNCIRQDVSSITTSGDVYLFESSKPGCENVLTLHNDGGTLTVIHNEE